MDQSNPRLEQARLNYGQFGACEERWVHDVRPPRTGER
jgi:Cysteine-rich CPCC